MSEYEITNIHQLFNGFVVVSHFYDLKEKDKPEDTSTEIRHNFSSNIGHDNSTEIQSDFPSNIVHDTKDKSFMCSICGRLYKAKKNLNAHVYQFHSQNNKDYSCKICLKSYPQLFLLKRHQRCTHEANFNCDICKKPFKTSFNLKRHKLKLH